MEGPLRCILCKESEESLKHLFLECKLSREVWHQAYKDMHFDLTLPTNWNDLFACWKEYYHGSLSNKPDFMRAWEALPRYIYWKIWKTKNKENFKGGKQSGQSCGNCKSSLGGSFIHEGSAQHQQGIIDSRRKRLGL